MDEMTKKLNDLLAEAGLPPESEVLNRNFSFTFYDAKNNVGYRISGVICGTDFCYADSHGYCLVRLMTMPLIRAREDDTASPVISYRGKTRFGSGDSHWTIYFYHNDANGRPDQSQLEQFPGTLVLL